MDLSATWYNIAIKMFICKSLRLNYSYSKLSDEEKVWFQKIAEKLALLKKANY